ncbi:MAG: 2-C-methyl-D-erythritol 2,4-cyclodiphosphate synthase, partial [Acidobacteria bacterium]|nr:2-C-methyl-D-erythritol 2,4-cyclodiphosphate synthase [Acidobacteriota bacterium]
MIKIRSGVGYDIHRLAPGDGLMLGGVKISAALKAEAHSDGDVLVHSLIDALLGAMGGQDIGELFP